MPELPDITVYVEALRDRLPGQALLSIRIRSPFLLRSVDPPPDAAVGLRVTHVNRIGKRIVVSFGDVHLVVHLMIAGRLRWDGLGDGEPAARGVGRPGIRPPNPRKKSMLAFFRFENGILEMTEAGTKHRASLHVVRGDEGLRAFDRGGVEVLNVSSDEFAGALKRENHTVKRALTDPRIVSGIGNSFSDEILHAAQISPFKQTGSMSDEDIERLYRCCRSVLDEWTTRLHEQAGEGFPRKVTAFRPEMAVHGKYGKPCPVCGETVQRIRYAENEANYCPTCQTGGKLLADRALSRLLKDDWPATADELERLTKPREGTAR